MERINKTISWYQSKVSAYDKQLWEMSVEQKVTKSFRSMPRKIGSLKSELIDVDLVRGSTFSKAKPSHTWPAITRKGLMRILFLPFHYRWWIQQTSTTFYGLMMLLYCCQIFAGIIYVFDSGNNTSVEQVSVAEMVSPVIFMLILGIIHCQIVSTHSGHKQRLVTGTKKKKKTTKVKKKKNSNRSSKHTSGVDTAQETGAETNTEDRFRTNLLLSNKREHSILLEQDGTTSDSSIQSEAISKSKAEQSHLIPDLNKNVDKCLLNQTENIVKSASSQTYAVDSVTATNEKKLKEKANILPSSYEASGARPKEPLASKRKTSSSEDTTDSFEVVTGEHIVYKPLNADDTVEANIYEDTTMLNQPIIETTGELLLASHMEDEYLQNNRPVNDDDPDKLGDVEAACPEVIPTIELEYIPSDHEQDQGTLNLLGIKHRKSIGQKDSGRSRKISTSDVDDIDDENNDGSQIATGQVPDPIITINDLAGDELSDNSSPERKNWKETTTYIPSSDQDPEGGKINLVGIKKRQQIGTTLRRRRRSTTKMDIPQNGGVPCVLPTSSRTRKIPESLSVRLQDRQTGALVISSGESEADSTATNSPLTPKVIHLLPPYQYSSDENGESDCHDRTSVHTGTLSEMEWEDRMRSSEMATSDTSSFSSSEGEEQKESGDEDPFGPTTSSHPIGSALPSAHDTVSCVIWEKDEVKKVDLSVIDLGWHIIDRVEKIPEFSDYVIMGMLFSILVFGLPVVFRAYHARDSLDVTTPHGIRDGAETVFGKNWRMYVVMGNLLFQRLALSLIFFFLLSVAERTFKQRLLYAKNFCYLTSSRKSRRYDLPHFRLNKVRNIKTWLSLRSYLKRKGPQRSVNTVVSAAFLLSVVLMSLMCIQLLKDSEHFLEYFYNWDLIVWSLAFGIYLLRYMTLGTKINKKYRNLSVLITEQINLYLHMEQKPHKKEELMLANNVLKLAEDLLKELESPFKLAGLSVNPYFYNITKIVILSAFSAVASEMMGFKLKLYKIKLKP